jgi:hypothetical protein
MSLVVLTEYSLKTVLTRTKTKLFLFKKSEVW